MSEGPIPRGGLEDSAADQLTADDLHFLEKLDEYRRFNQLEFFQPYPKQSAFIAMGKEKNERCLFAGNQYGKSMCGAYETACHLTGLYPADWLGRKWDRPVNAWAAGETTTLARDIQQRQLFGQPGVDTEFGTGFIPRHCINGRPTLARGAVADAYDTASIQHYTDGVKDGFSTLQFKSYEQGRKKFQGRTLDFVWWDEEPDEDIYTEGNARWTATGGMSFLTFTPLQAMSLVVKRFRNESSYLRGYVQMEFKDALHLGEKDMIAMKEKYPAYQWRARIDGLPLLGAGQVFLTEETKLHFDPGAIIPVHWLKLWGLDFGIGHNFGAALCAYDRETDVFYVLKTYRVAGAIPITHVDAILRIGGEQPVAWPHDGTQRDKGGTNASETLADQYKKLGLRMLPAHATWPEGGYSSEAAVLEMQQRMADGRFRVSADLADWFEEYRMYHRQTMKDTGASVLVKKDDDLLSATMKAVMMKRFGRPGPILSAMRRPKLYTAKAPASTNFDIFTGRPFVE
jgi:phage terminase large subunit-like protein